MEITCINCPVGCRLQITVEDGCIKQITGNQCKRGAVYAKQECTAPRRMITAEVPVKGSRMPLSVKTREAIPKELILACMAALSNVELVAPVAAGTVVLENVCATGVDIIATKSV